MELPRNLSCLLLYIWGIIYTGWSQEPCSVQVISTEEFALLNQWVLLNCTFTCSTPTWESRLQKRNTQEEDHWVSTEVLVNDWEKSNITCISEDQGEVLQSTVIVAAYALPSKVTIDLEVELEEGQPHEVTCTVFEVAPLANLHISVMREGRVIDTTSFVGETNKGKQSLSESFYFSVSRRDNLQDFYCEATLDVGSVEDNIVQSEMINVKTFAKPEVPLISMTPSTTIKEGESITLTCQSEGFPEPDYSWIIPSSTHVTYSENNQKVTITKATFAHKGNYFCVASNQYGRVRGEQFVDIINNPGAPPDSPLIIVSPKTAKEGESLNITCQAGGFPEPEYFWTIPSKDHVTFSSDKRDIFINKSTSAHNGTYKCEAKNTHGNASNQLVLRMIEKPKAQPHTPLIMALPNKNVREGESLNLTCLSGGFPEPEYFWIIPSKHHVTFSADKREVFITKTTSAHNGTYKCEAQNTYGKVSSQLAIRIELNGVFHTQPTAILIASALATILALL